nr:receptor-like protein 12 [Ipomoea batatas]
MFASFVFVMGLFVVFLLPEIKRIPIDEMKEKSLSSMAMDGENKSLPRLIGEFGAYNHDTVTIMNKGNEMVLLSRLEGDNDCGNEVVDEFRTRILPTIEKLNDFGRRY